MNCSICPLARTRRRIALPEVLGDVPRPRILVVAEAPGEEEDRAGRPMIGRSGREARSNLILNGLTARGVILDNVARCHPPENRDPTPEEIEECTRTHLLPEVRSMQPEFIISMGRVSTMFFLEKAGVDTDGLTMELLHGIPRWITIDGLSTTLIPTYHPAAGLHSPEQMILFQRDMRVAGGVVRGSIPPVAPTDEFEGRENYRLSDDPDEIRETIGNSPVVAIDTEWAKGEPWCLSFSVAPGTSTVVMADSGPALSVLNETLRGRTTAIHNALYDLPVLERMGVVPERTSDTMVMAYLLQDEPQGLKPLAFRHSGMRMSSYSDMVGAATWVNAMEYLTRASELKWGRPEPVLEWMKGEPKVRQPQSLNRKIKRILKEVSTKGANPADRWNAVKEGKEPVESLFGPLREGELCDIPLDKAVYYSARDADATIRVYPLLWDRIIDMKLEGTFWRDMAALPMVVDMMENGMPVDLAALSELSLYLQGKMDETQRKIQLIVKPHGFEGSVNPGSYTQMSRVIYDLLRLHERGGTFKSKNGAKSKSTANDILSRYVALHPIVPLIIQWREYQKLKTSYADSIPKMVSPDGRIRTTLRITRTTTGRLSSSKPNLMAQPQRSSEGRRVRDCYVAPPGYVFLSGDYSQVEMRVAASHSADEKMMKIFWSGIDIHSQTASDMFGVPMAELDEMKHRYPAKRVGFGILNLITAEGLQRELSSGGAGNWTVSDAADMIKAWFEIYSGVAAYMKRNGEHAKRYGYVRDLWGRVRYIPGIRSDNRWARIEAERQAGNAPIQMGAQGVIKEAMGRLVPVYRARNIKPLIQIHDDIVWELPESEVHECAAEIRSVMESSGPPGFLVPLEVDFKYGPRWGSMKGKTGG